MSSAFKSFWLWSNVDFGPFFEVKKKLRNLQGVLDKLQSCIEMDLRNDNCTQASHSYILYGYVIISNYKEPPGSHQ